MVPSERSLAGEDDKYGLGDVAGQMRVIRTGAGPRRGTSPRCRSTEAANTRPQNDGVANSRTEGHIIVHHHIHGRSWRFRTIEFILNNRPGRMNEQFQRGRPKIPRISVLLPAICRVNSQIRPHMSKIIGIDLGTTNSLVATARWIQAFRWSLPDVGRSAAHAIGGELSGAGTQRRWWGMRRTGCGPSKPGGDSLFGETIHGTPRRGSGSRKIMLVTYPIKADQTGAVAIPIHGRGSFAGGSLRRNPEKS